MPKSTTKATSQKRTTVKDIPAKVKDVSSKEGKRVKGGFRSSRNQTLTINGTS
jgi:hypothetical protein